jgi:hypothetical protein
MRELPVATERGCSERVVGRASGCSSVVLPSRSGLLKVESAAPFGVRRRVW